MSYEAEVAMARIEKGIADAQQRAARAREFRAQVDGTLGRGEVDGVVAEVDLTGVVRSIRLPRQLQYRDAERLEASIMEAIRAGHVKAAEQGRAAAEAAFGHGSQTAEAFSRELDSRFATQRGDEEGRR
ncbi:MAG: YbaB/EbfC family nucleoid-associated protein [Nocardioides sp.]|nr:YbaB/EbfC family nucleoid-associated protein [Nocardioides sp.]